MDRAHRIGQTKQVYVFRLITEVRTSTVSYMSLNSPLWRRTLLKNVCLSGLPRSCGWINLLFNKGERRSTRVCLVIMLARYAVTDTEQTAANKEELLDIIHHGAEKIVNSSEE